MVDIRPNALPSAILPLRTGDAVIVDQGADGVRQTNPVSFTDSVAPVATQSEAQTGSDNTKRMTPLRTKQSIASEVGVTLASNSQGSKADTAVQSVNGKTGNSITLDKSDVGLGNVDNTSDANKPVSTAQQTALDLKANASVTISAGTGLTGGGTLSANRTIALNSTSIASLAKADSSVQTVNGVAPTSGNVNVAGGIPDDGSVTNIKLSDSLSSGIMFASVDVNSLKNVDTSRYKISYLLENNKQGIFIWKTDRNYTGDVAADVEGVAFIASNSTPPSDGCWVRDSTGMLVAGTMRYTPGMVSAGLLLGGAKGLYIMQEGLVGDEGSWAVYPGTSGRSSALSLAPSGLPSEMNNEDTSSIAFQLQNGTGDGHNGERRGGIAMKKWAEMRMAAFRTSSDAGPIPFMSMVIQDRRLVKMADDNVVRVTNELVSNGASGGNTVFYVENPTPGTAFRFVALQNGVTQLERIEAGQPTTVVNVGNNGIAIGGAGVAQPTHRLEAITLDATQAASAHHASSASYSGEVVRVTTTRAKANTFAFQTFRANGDLTFNLRGDGNAFADGAWTGGGADYAEYFEWEDGNTYNEDRTGKSVVLVGEKIKIAELGDDPIGVVSSTAVIIGDVDIGHWKGKYLRDDLGRYITEKIDAVSWLESVPAVMVKSTQEHNIEIIVDADGNDVCPKWQAKELGVIVTPYHTTRTKTEIHVIDVEKEPAKTIEHSYYVDSVPEDMIVPDDAKREIVERRKLNPDYDSDREHVSREKRKEWSAIGLMGKLRVIKGQPVGRTWVKMRDVSDNVEEWLVK